MEQLNSFYIRLDSDFISNRTSQINDVANFENSLDQPLKLDNYNVALNDIHLQAVLDSNALSNSKDYNLTIIEKIDSFAKINNVSFNKWLVNKPITLTMERQKLIADNWAFVNTPGYTSRITTPFSEREIPVLLRTDIPIRTDLAHTEFLDDAEDIRTSDIEIEETDEHIRALLESELRELKKGATETSYSIHNMRYVLLNHEFESLMDARIQEWKKRRIFEVKLDMLQKELAKYPTYQNTWDIETLNLNDFLKHITATLWSHPLYAFYDFEHWPGSINNRVNVVLRSGRHDDKSGDLLFKFSEKSKKILQSKTTEIDPILGLENVRYNSEISNEYPSSFPAYLEASLIDQSYVGCSSRKIIKTIVIDKKSLTIKLNIVSILISWNITHVKNIHLYQLLE